MDEPRGWYSRGYLPHIDAGSAPQFLTWRLNDSLPASLLELWREELRTLSDPERKKEFYRRVEEHLDSRSGACVLRNPVAGSIVQKALIHDHGKRYDLHAWCVMPNHVHTLLTPIEGITLEEIVRTLKSFTSNEIRKSGLALGKLWQPDYFDRLIRDANHFERTAKYIEWNPVKAKLCTDPNAWPFSSASKFEFVADR